MVKRLLDKGVYDILEFKFQVNTRGHGVIEMRGIGQSQGEDVEFCLKTTTSALKSYPVISDIEEKQVKRGPGRPPKTTDDD